MASQPRSLDPPPLRPCGFVLYLVSLFLYWTNESETNPSMLACKKKPYLPRTSLLLWWCDVLQRFISQLVILINWSWRLLLNYKNNNNKQKSSTACLGTSLLLPPVGYSPVWDPRASLATLTVVTRGHTREPVLLLDTAWKLQKCKLRWCFITARSSPAVPCTAHSVVCEVIKAMNTVIPCLIVVF